MAARNQDQNVKLENAVAENGGMPNNPQNRENPRDNPHMNQQHNNFRGRRPGPGGGNREPFNQHRNMQQGGDMKDRKFHPKRFGGPKNAEGGNQGMIPRNIEDRIHERLAQLNGPTFDLPALDMIEKKFSGRNRLYVGNLPADLTEEEFNDIFKPYGETSEIFINKEKNFGFIRLDFHTNAEKAKRELDGIVKKGRPLKVRFAPNNATIKVKNLTPYVTNELLHAAFSVFGEIERCVVLDRTKSAGEGIVEFVRKPAAQLALKHCNDGCFFLTSSLRPVIVELYEQVDNTDGFPEKSIKKKTPDYHQAREIGPRFATPGSFEYEYGTRWKQLHELYKQKGLSLKQELQMEEDKLEAQMQFAKFENETEMLREQLRAREMDRERQKREWEERERLAEEQRIRNEEQMRHQQEEMTRRMHHQEEDLRRRQQENTLFMQAHQLSNMLDQQEQVMQSYNSPNNQEEYDPGNDGNGNPMDPQAFMNSYERSHRYDGRGMGDMGPSGPNRGRGHWGNDMRRDDYPNKRRRY